MEAAREALNGGLVGSTSASRETFNGTLYESRMVTCGRLRMMVRGRPEGSRVGLPWVLVQGWAPARVSHNVARPHDVPFEEPKEADVAKHPPNPRVPKHVRAVAPIPAPPLGTDRVVVRVLALATAHRIDGLDLLVCGKLSSESEAVGARDVLDEWLHATEQRRAIVGGWAT